MATAASTTSAAADVETVRELKGVMRVGLLAKGLLLHGDLELQLVVLCHNRPTRSLLLYLAERLPAELEVIVVTDIFELYIYLVFIARLHQVHEMQSIVIEDAGVCHIL